MGITLPTDVTSALLDIHAAGPDRRESMVNDFIANRWEQWKKIAVQKCHASGRDPLVHADDVMTLISMSAWKMLNRIIDGGPVEIHRLAPKFNYELQKSARNSVRAYFYSEAGGAPASGMDNTIRRQNQIRLTRVELEKRGLANPTDAEVIEETNARLLTNRKDAAREGILVSEADLKAPGFNISYDSLSTETTDGLGHQEEYVLFPIESRKIVSEVVEASYAVNHDLGMVAELWVGDLYPDNAGLMQQSEIVKETGLTKQQVSRSIAKIKKIARDLLEAKLSAEDLAEYM